MSNLEYSFNIANLTNILEEKDYESITIFFGDGDFLNLNSIPLNNINHVYKTVGAYIIIVLIKLTNGQYISNSELIRIPSYLAMPEIIGENELTCDNNLQINLTANIDNSLLIEGQEIIKYEWRLNNEVISENKNLSYEYNSDCNNDNTLEFYCRVSDNIGNVSDWAVFTVEVKI